MFLARVRTKGGLVCAARVDESSLVTLGHLAPDTADDPLGLLDRFGADGLATQAERARGENGRLVAVEDVTFAPPVKRCSKLVCLALNYRKHAEEGNLRPPGAPVLFFKPPTTIVAHDEPVVCPRRSQRLDYEVELAVVISRRAKNVPADSWQDVVAGYTILNDVTARDIQLRAIEANEPWDRSKGFDTFAPLGPYLVTPDEVPDPHDLVLETRVGDRVAQHSNTGMMLFRIPELIEDITAGITFQPGDVIGTGTPEGIGPAYHGETMEAEVGHFGVLRNPVVFESESLEAVPS